MLGNFLGWSLIAAAVFVGVFFLVGLVTGGLPCQEYSYLEFAGQKLRGQCISHGTWGGVEADNAPEIYASIAGFITVGVIIFRAWARGD